MAYNVIVMLLVISLLLLFVVYFKYVKMKQHFCLLEIACVYALYTINNKDKRLYISALLVQGLFVLRAILYYNEDAMMLQEGKFFSIVSFIYESL